VGVLVGSKVGVGVAVGLIEAPSTVFVTVGVGEGVIGTTWLEFNVRACLVKATKRRAAINNSVFFTPGMYSFILCLSNYELTS
jgi:hypothetical protein